MQVRYYLAYITGCLAVLLNTVSMCIDQCCIHRVPLVRSVAPNNSSFPMYLHYYPRCSTAAGDPCLIWAELISPHSSATFPLYTSSRPAQLQHPAAYLPHVTHRAPCLKQPAGCCYIFVHICSNSSSMFVFSCLELHAMLWFRLDSLKYTSLTSFSVLLVSQRLGFYL